MIAISDSTMIVGANVAAASGNSGTANRRNPYAPSLSRIPARITEPAVGASVCASGSHVWNGNIGTLIANARKNARKAPTWRAGAKPEEAAKSRSVTKSKALAHEPVADWYANAVARIATSISSEPTSVYSTNLIVEQIRFGAPQIPMMRYIGTRTTSQKM